MELIFEFVSKICSNIQYRFSALNLIQYVHVSYVYVRNLL